MKILLLGATGMLSGSFPAEKVVKLNHSHLDITRPDEISRQVKRIKPRLIINCTSITDIPFCEANPAIAFQVNLAGAINLAVVCKEYRIKLVQFSTVFSGEANIYTKTKMHMEHILQEVLEDTAILRLPWLFSKEGDRKFLSTTINCLKSNKPVPVYEDEVGSPTYAGDIAEYVLKNGLFIKGAQEIANKGSVTRKEWASKIAKILGYQDIRFKPIKREIPMNKNSVVRTGIILRPWEEALKECLG